MKIKKFLSIGLGLMRENECSGNSRQSGEAMDVEGLYDAMKKLEEALGQQGTFYFENQAAVDKETVFIHVFDDSGKGIPSEVRFFPLLGGESFMNYNHVNGKINLIREMTDFEGLLKTELPVGEYYTEISSGSEYKINKVSLIVKHGTSNDIVVELSPIINLSCQGWIAGDLHHHSIYSSSLYGGDDSVFESPEEVCN